MKYCNNCGSEMTDQSHFCPICGANANGQTNNYQNTYTNNYQPIQTKANGMAIAGFILAFLIPLLGWIFGGIGLKNASKCNSGKGLAIAALIVATLNWILGMLIQLDII